MSTSQNLEERRKQYGFPEASFTVARIQQMVSKKLRRLSKEKLLSVLDFVEFLSQPSKVPTASALPEPTAFLECAGTWEFAPGELDSILATLEQMRDLDLEEQDAHTSRLLA
jgi:hypothetical protein